jgi:hypothetical protein
MTSNQQNRVMFLAKNLKIQHSLEYWLILNKLAAYKKWSPNTISSKIKELGMICFNNDINHHPIDWLYNEYLNNK